MLDRLLRRIEEGNERYLAELPVHERDQALAAARTWRGTFRYIWTKWTRRV